MQQRPDEKQEKETLHEGLSETGCRRTLRDDGVSEAVGTMLLITIIAVGISIFVAAVVLQPVNSAPPAFTFNVSYGQGGEVYIRHLGGEPVSKDLLHVYIDDGEAGGTAEDVQYLLEIDDSTTWDIWHIGETLVYTPSPSLTEPPEVAMTYADQSGAQYLYYASYNWTGAIPTVTPGTPPVAAFSASPISGTAPLTVRFADSSTNGPTRWSWTFGDGGTSNDRNPEHTYAASGTYTVSLTADNAFGSDTETKTHYITVTVPSAPVADFIGTPLSGTAPLTVRFTDTSTNGPTSWAWTFGDGGTSTEQNPSHTYAAAGTYTVTLTATNAGGSDTETKTGYVTVAAPVVHNIYLYSQKASHFESGGYYQFEVGGSGGGSLSIAGNSVSLHPGDIIRLTLGSDTTGTIGADTTGIWNFPSANIIVTKNGIEVGSGTLNSINAWGTSFTGSTITVKIPAAMAGTTFRVDGSTIISGQDERQIVIYNIQPSTGGSLWLRTAGNEVNINPCGAESYQLIPPPPAADFSASPTSGSAPLTVQFTDTSTNGPTSWAWTFGDGGTSTLQNPSHTYASAGTYTVTLTATNAGGSDTETKTGYITVTEPSAPVADFTGTPLSGPAPLTVQFTDTSTDGPTSWAWNFGDSGTSTEQNPSHTYAAVGTYTVSLTATNAEGSDTETKTGYVTVATPASAKSVTLDTYKSGALQPGGYLQFRVTGADSYVTVAGQQHQLDVGDIVRLTIGTDGNGNIYANGGQINPFSFDDVTVHVNGAEVGSGTINGIWISGSDSFSSTLTMVVVSGMAQTYFAYDGTTLFNYVNDNHQITLYNVRPNSGGLMQLTNPGSDRVYYVGGAENYALGPGAAPTVTAISPNNGRKGDTVWPTITGTEFMSGATVKLTRTGKTDIVATNINVNSPTSIGCKIVLPSSNPYTGDWNVVVTNSDGQSGTLVNGFNIYN